MNRNMLAPIMILAMLNGIFSPFVLGVFLTWPLWYPSFLPAAAQGVYFASALILSTLTIMIAGVPAALYERFAAPLSGKVTGMVWLAVTALLTLPALGNMLRAMGAG